MLSLEQLLDLDFVSVLDLEEKLTIEMNVMNAIEVDGAFYMLATCVDEDDYVDEDEEEEEEEEDTDTEDAYVFKVCSEEEAEFLITEDYSELQVFVTTDFSQEEFSKAAEILSKSDNYDLEIEESDNND